MEKIRFTGWNRYNVSMLQPFWHTKTLEEMTPEEWESLCDGCARCCLIKFQDEDTDRIYTTNVVTLTPSLAAQLTWMPETCAYRLLAEGKELPLWHPLVSGDAKTVHQAGISVRGKVVSGRDVDEEDLPDYVVDGD